MKLDVNNTDWEDLDDLPIRQKIVKKTKIKEQDSDKDSKSKKNSNYRKNKEEQ